MWQSMPWQPKKLDANLIDWIVMLSMLSVGVTLLWILIYKNEILYSMCHFIQTLKLCFSIFLLLKIDKTKEVQIKCWKHLITFEWFIKSIFIGVRFESLHWYFINSFVNLGKWINFCLSFCMHAMEKNTLLPCSWKLLWHQK